MADVRRSLHGRDGVSDRLSGTPRAPDAVVEVTSRPMPLAGPRAPPRRSSRHVCGLRHAAHTPAAGIAPSSLARPTREGVPGGDAQQERMRSRGPSVAAPRSPVSSPRQACGEADSPRATWRKRFAGLPIDDMYGRRAGSRRRVVTAPLAAAAIQFPSGHPAVACVVVGAQAAGEVRQNAADLAVEIPDQLWTDLREHGLLNPVLPVPPRAETERRRSPAEGRAGLFKRAEGGLAWLLTGPIQDA